MTRWLILQKARRHTADGCSDCSWARGFRRCFTPLSGCFSPFPHGTGSLSVAGECSALEGGPPCFARGFTCPALLWESGTRCLRLFGYGALTLFRRPSQAVPLRGRFMTAAEGGAAPSRARPATPARKRPHAVTRAPVWAGPVSLAATPGISVDFSSSGYLDVSVPPVASWPPYLIQAAGSGALPPLGSPIRESRGSKAVCASPAAYRSLPRPSSTSRAKASASRP